MQNGDKSCNHCGTKLSTFLKTGFLGCNCCYMAFEKEIGKMLPSMQMKSENKGKKCDGTLIEEDLLDLRLTLTQMRDYAAEEQRYGDAEIIESQLKKLNGASL